MIRFDLRCEAAHEFEGWFRNNAAYDEQAAAGALACPVCGSTVVEKAIMAPAIAGNRSASEDGKAKLAAMLTMLRAAHEHVRTNFEHVGDRFAAEARAIHEGIAEKRDIYGRATEAEARDLAKDGIGFGVLPDLPKQDA